MVIATAPDSVTAPVVARYCTVERRSRACSAVGRKLEPTG